MEIETTIKKDETTFRDKNSNYVLIVRTMSTDLPLEVFKPFFEVYFQLPEQDGACLITTRNKEEYDREFRSIPINPNFIYLETGAGLGGFIPHLVTNIRPKNKPIIIDPVDYKPLHSLLLYAREQDISERTNTILQDVIRRCEIINDATKVRLFNLSLENAIEQYSGLRGIADVTLDLCGLSLNLNSKKTESLLRYLTKENGFVFISN